MFLFWSSKVLIWLRYYLEKRTLPSTTFPRIPVYWTEKHCFSAQHWFSKQRSAPVFIAFSFIWTSPHTDTSCYHNGIGWESSLHSHKSTGGDGGTRKECQQYLQVSACSEKLLPSTSSLPSPAKQLWNLLAYLSQIRKKPRKYDKSPQRG